VGAQKRPAVGDKTLNKPLVFYSPAGTTCFQPVGGFFLSIIVTPS